MPRTGPSRRDPTGIARQIARENAAADRMSRADDLKRLRAENERLRGALVAVRHEICTGPVDDVLWHAAVPAETTVDFICNTLGDDWSYGRWAAEQALAKEPDA